MKTLSIVIATNDENRDRAFSAGMAECGKVPFLQPELVVHSGLQTRRDASRALAVETHNWFNTDFALFVEFDSMIMNPMAWNDEFFDYDYIGAPWDTLNPHYPKRYRPDGYTKDRLVGNSGFCLRSKRLCEELRTLSHLYPNDENSDVFICLNVRDELERRGIRFAPYDIAKKFSVERNEWSGQFGVHDWFRVNGTIVYLKNMDERQKGELYTKMISQGRDLG